MKDKSVVAKEFRDCVGAGDGAAKNGCRRGIMKGELGGGEIITVNILFNGDEVV